MKPIPDEWLFPESLKLATGVQRELAARILCEDDFGPIEAIGGTDISCRFRDPRAPVHAAIVTLGWPDLAVREVAGASLLPPFPYVSGYLGFRESPSLVDAFAQLERKPDLLFVDGQGIAHPRGLGIASHLGLLLDVPTIGVAKSVLVGESVGELGPQAGDCTPLVWQDRTVAMVVRTKPRCRPLYISVGHRISLTSAVEQVLRAVQGYRMPEPTRLAHDAANQLRRRADVFTS